MGAKNWKVKIPSGHWMAGIHRFGTRKAAQEFVTYWLSTFNEIGPTPTLTIVNDDPRKVRDQIMRDCGLTKVRGALGGTYWE